MQTPGLQLRSLLATGPVMIPGASQPLIARLIEQAGFSAMYLSGAAFSAGQLALPDVGLFTLSELVTETQRLTRASSLPLIVDADTGFGEALMVERTVRELAAAGAAAIQLEDQLLPKRCGHLTGKTLISTEQMVTKLRAAVAAKPDPSLMIIARTDARSVEGFEAAMQRARAYVAAGADAIFVEALPTAAEFAAARSELAVPLIANMTEFGQTPLIDMATWKELGYNGVLFPVSTLRIALKQVARFLKSLHESGSQRDFLPEMLTRQELYDLLDYQGYEARDRDYFQGTG